MDRLREWRESAWGALKDGYDNHVAKYWNDYPWYTKSAFLILGSSTILGTIYLVYNKFIGKISRTKKVDREDHHERQYRNDYSTHQDQGGSQPFFPKQQGQSHNNPVESKPVHSEEDKDIILELKSSIIKLKSDTGSDVVSFNIDHIYLIEKIFEYSGKLIEGNVSISDNSLAFHWNKDERLCGDGLKRSSIPKRLNEISSESVSKIRQESMKAKRSPLKAERNRDGQNEFLEIGGNDESELHDLSLAKIQLDWVFKIYQLLTSENNTESLYSDSIKGDSGKVLKVFNQINKYIDRELWESESRYIENARITKPLSFGSPTQSKSDWSVFKFQSHYIDLLQYLYNGFSSVVNKSEIPRKVFHWGEGDKNNILFQEVIDLQNLDKDISKVYDDTKSMLLQHSELFIDFNYDDDGQVYRLSYVGDTEGSKDTVQKQVEMFNEQIAAMGRFVDLFIKTSKEDREEKDYGEGNTPENLVELFTNFMNDMKGYISEYEPIKNVQQQIEHIEQQEEQEESDKDAEDDIDDTQQQDADIDIVKDAGTNASQPDVVDASVVGKGGLGTKPVLTETGVPSKTNVLKQFMEGKEMESEKQSELGKGLKHKKAKTKVQQDMDALTSKSAKTLPTTSYTSPVDVTQSKLVPPMVDANGNVIISGTVQTNPTATDNDSD